MKMTKLLEAQIALVLKTDGNRRESGGSLSQDAHIRKGLLELQEEVR
ncbi:hypothetical protein V9K67_20615 [Paraflavisolibacter sp. H34]